MGISNHLFISKRIADRGCFGAYYFFQSSKKSGESRVTDENRLLGRARLDRDLSDRTFAFGQITAEYDEI